MAPPSRHISGGFYSWESDIFSDVHIAKVPEKLIEVFNEPSQRSQPTEQAEVFQEGCRNDSLMRLAGRLRKGGLGPDGIFSALMGINTSMCRPPLEEDEVLQIARSASRYKVDSKSTNEKLLEWGEVKQLPDLNLTAPKMDRSMIPKPVRSWVIDCCERLQVPYDFIMIPFLIALSSVVGRQIAIRPKKNDLYTVLSNLWGALVARPSTFKSPSINEALKPLLRLANQADKDFKSDQLDSEIKILAVEADIKNIEKKLGKMEPYEREESLLELRELKLEIEKLTPKHRRFVLGDSTIEKTAEILNDNQNGVLVYRDELSGFLTSFEKRGHEQDRAFYLESWSGTQSHNVDRIGRGSISIPALCLSVLGGIQPAPLKKYVVDTVANSASNDGFLQRFQMLVYPEDQREWVLIDRVPDYKARSKVIRIFERLADIDTEDLKAKISKDDPLPYLNFTEKAQGTYNEWICKLEGRLRTSGVQPEALESHLGKYRSLMPSLSLLFHLLCYGEEDLLGGPVRNDCAKLAVRWCEYLEEHAKKVYSLVELTQVDSAKALLAKIRQGRIKDGDTLRSIYRHHWSQLDTARKVEQAAEILSECEIVKVTDLQTSGRPSEIIKINPEILKEIEAARDKTAGSPSRNSSDTFVTPNSEVVH